MKNIETILFLGLNPVFSKDDTVKEKTFENFWRGEWKETNRERRKKGILNLYYYERLALTSPEHMFSPYAG
jgi:hypothetical protein